MKNEKVKIGIRKKLGDVCMKVKDMKNNSFKYFWPAYFYYGLDVGVIEGRSGIMTPQETPGGYLAVTISDEEQIPHTMLVHRLIAYLWWPKTPERDEVHHINGNRKDNRPCNLIWVSPEEHDELDKLSKGDNGIYWNRIREIRRDSKERGKYGE